jgi:hypothetical protein
MEVRGANLHEGQKRLIGEIFKSDTKYNVMNISRQFGKTFMLGQIVLYYGFNTPSSYTLFCQPTHAQAKKVMTDIVNAIQGSGLIKNYNISDRKITLSNNSIIHFTGLENPDALRGLSVDYMYIDEAAFIDEDTFTKVLRPMLAVAGKKCFLVSTPKGKNYFYKLAILGQNEDNDNYSYYTANYEENPLYDLSEIDDAKANLPTNIFKQEYLAMFLDNEGTVFTNIDNVSTLSEWSKEVKNGERYYAGLDLGRQDDYTVLSIMNSKGEVVYIYRDRHKTWDTIVGNVVTHLKRFKVVKCMVEVNNIGDVIYEQIVKIFQRVEPIVTSNASKANYIERLSVDIEQCNISLPNNNLFQPLLDELGVFEYEFSRATRAIKYGAPKGHHDDTVISLAICNLCKFTYGRGGNNTIMF